MRLYMFCRFILPPCHMPLPLYFFFFCCFLSFHCFHYKCSLRHMTDTSTSHTPSHTPHTTTTMHTQTTITPHHQHQLKHLVCGGGGGRRQEPTNRITHHTPRMGHNTHTQQPPPTHHPKQQERQAEHEIEARQRQGEKIWW